MIVDALSLVGLLDEKSALNYFEKRCVFPSRSRRLFLEHFRTARELVNDAARPDASSAILDMPSEAQSYLYKIARLSRFWDTVENTDWSFKLVPIDALISYQFEVCTERAERLCKQISKPPKIAELLALCLPEQCEESQATLEEISDLPGGPINGCIIRSAQPNLRILARGKGSGASRGVYIAGPLFGIAVPYVQVVRFNGRCFLKNGYHRVLGMRQAGATHVPCILFESSDFKFIGAVPGKSFERGLLESSRPPLCAHFSPGIAFPVRMQLFEKVIEVRWSESDRPLQ